MQPHYRQFIYGPRPVKLYSNWITTPMSWGGYLSHCPGLRVEATRDENGNSYALLGLAVQTDPHRPDPVCDLLSDDSVPGEHYKSWAGRWVLLANGQVHLDAVGLLGCYYHTAKAGEKVWVSSSAAILAKVLSAKRNAAREIFHGRGINWYPPPQSRFDSIYCLHPSQILDLTSGEIIPRPLVCQQSESISYDALLDRLQDYLVYGMKQVARLSRSLWLSLTAGADSRLILATIMYAQIPVKAYTQTYSFMINSDLEVPPRLAHIAGIEHHVFKGGRFSSEIARLCDEHTGGHAQNEDKNFLSRSQFDWCKEGDIILRGNVFEVAGCGFWKYLPASTKSWEVPESDTMIKGLNDVAEPSLVEGLEAWRAWTLKNPSEEMDWRDRFYLEQRVAGCWGATEQLLDLIKAERFLIANSQVYLSTALQVPAEKRLVKGHHLDLIDRMAPGLSRFPINARDHLVRRVLRRAALRVEMYMHKTNDIREVGGASEAIES
jgi:hypothetical protein